MSIKKFELELKTNSSAIFNLFRKVSELETASVMRYKADPWLQWTNV